MLGSGVQHILASFSYGEVKEKKGQNCLGLILKQPVCGLCAAVCSSNALILNKGVHISQDNCDQCGRCASVCPTGYLKLEGFSSGIVEKISQRIGQGQQIFIFKCNNSRHQVPNAVSVPCLCSLRAGYLVYWISLGARKIFYDISGCAVCDSEVQKCLDLELRRARNLITAWHLPGEIITTDSLPTEIISATSNSLQFSRRGFFEYLGRQARTATRDIIESYLNNLGSNATIQLPEDRLYLMDAFQRLGWIPVEKFSTGDLPWLDMVIKNGRCSTCHVCSTFCPTGAIKRFEVNGKTEIRFLAARCVACGFCIAACPTHSLQPAKKTNIAMLRKERVLATGNAVVDSGPGGFMHEV